MLQESRRRVKLEKKEPLVESQLFIMELARELNRICQVTSPLPPFCATQTSTCSTMLYALFCMSSEQRSSILSHVWTSEDVWPPAVCRDFIVEWAAVLEKRVKVRHFLACWLFRAMSDSNQVSSYNILSKKSFKTEESAVLCHTKNYLTLP